MLSRRVPPVPTLFETADLKAEARLEAVRLSSFDLSSDRIPLDGEWVHVRLKPARRTGDRCDGARARLGPLRAGLLLSGPARRGDRRVC